jgi:hypothetical protein
MALLDTTLRQQIWRGLMRFWSRQRATLGALTKADLQAAVNATDDWIDQSAASFNSALPATARTQLTATQKTVLFCAVALARVGDMVLLRAIFGEVD